MSSRRPARGVIIGLAALCLVCLLVYLAVGTLAEPLGSLLTELFRGPGGSDSSLNSILWDIRLPRALTALGVGAVLGMAGCAFQAVFRNPLAEPYLVGVAGGAGFGGTIAVALGYSTLYLGLGTFAFAFIGAMVSLQLVFALAQRTGHAMTERLLIAGVMVGTLMASAMTVLLVLSGQDSAKILAWLLGSVTPAYWHKAGIIWLALLVSGAFLIRDARALNILAVSESSASSAGIDVRKLIRRIIFVGAGAAAAAVGSCGLIGFVGLVSPHLARRLVGVDVRWALPASALVGGSLLLLSDLAAQRLVRSTEMPVGAITALLGAASLIFIIKRSTVRFGTM